MRKIIPDYLFQGHPTKALKVYFEYDELKQLTKKNSDIKISEIIEELFKGDEYKTIPHLIIGCWGELWDDDAFNPNALIQDLILYKDRLAHLESLFIGDVDQDECEISWINQGEYSGLLEHYPNLKSLTIKGAIGSNSCLSFEYIEHPNLIHFELISGGLPSAVIDKIAQAKLPKLESLRLYFGVDDYGFDGTIETIKPLLKRSLFPCLTHLGLLNSEIQDELITALLASDILKGLRSLDLSMGTLTDLGGNMLLDHIQQLEHLDEITINYHYMSDDMVQKLEQSSLKIKLSDQQDNDDDWRYPMYSE